MNFGLVDSNNNLMTVESSYDAFTDTDNPEVEYYISNNKEAPIFNVRSIEEARDVLACRGNGSMKSPSCTISDLKVVQFEINITAEY